MMGWALKSLSSRRAKGLADTVVDRLGEQGLRKYVHTVDRMIPGRGDVSSALRGSLISLPSPRPAEFMLPASPAAFVYVTSPDDDMQYSCRMGFSGWEEISRWFFFLAARDSNLVLDIGSYSGVFGLTAAFANHRARIWAYEPDPKIQDVLYANVQRNGWSDRFKIHQVAVGDETGTCPLYLNPGDGRAPTLVASEGKHVLVERIRLDDVAADAAVDLMKVDVEGAESSVFRGATQLIARAQPVILAEALTVAELAEQRAVLAPLGYGEPEPMVRDTQVAESRNFVWWNHERRPNVIHMIAEARKRASES